MTDDDGDLFAYTMPRRLKLAFAEELARGMIELRRSNIVHCDIKPCNVLLVTVPQAYIYTYTYTYDVYACMHACMHVHTHTHTHKHTHT